jgi:hypothetical protein
MVLELATICAFELESDGGRCFYHSFQACKFSSKLWKTKGLHGLTFRPEQKLWV